MKLVLEIAKTHLTSKPKQTIIAMLGVTFGIGMFIAMVSLMTGLNNFTEQLTMTSSPDIHIYHDVTESRATILEQVNARGTKADQKRQAGDRCSALHLFAGFL
jgi:lipoprotein-releasing system permease protein